MKKQTKKLSEKGLDDMISRAYAPVNPSLDFTDRVMEAIEAKQSRGWSWFNLFYAVPTMAVLLILALPATRTAVLNSIDGDRAAIISVQEDVDQMQSLLGSLSSDFSADSLSDVE